MPLQLKPCPFCGGIANTGEVEGDTTVWCVMCGATVRACSDGGAIDLWNARVVAETAPSISAEAD